MSQIRPLTTLAFVATLWVVMYHFRYGALADQMPASFLYAKGHLGIPLIFILSGFILAHTYSASFATLRGLLSMMRSYVVARIARIYPVHLVVLLLFPVLLLPLGIWPRLPPDTTYSFVLSALLVSAWGFLDTVVWNQSSWPVSSLVLCYILFPALMLALAKLPRIVVWPVALGGTAFILSGIPLELLVRALPAALETNGILVKTLELVLLFIAGTLVHRAFGVGSARLGPAVTAMGVVLPVAAIVWLASLEGTEPWIYAAMAALIYVLAAGSGLATSALSAAPLVYLGAISYSLYLIHEPVRETMYFVAGTRTLPLILEVAIVIAAAALMFHLVERPSRAVIRRRFGPAAKKKS